MKINARLTLSFLIICFVPLVIISILANFTATGALTEQVLNHLESVASIQHARTHMVLDKYLERLILVTNNTLLKTSLTSYVKENNRSDLKRMNTTLLDICSALSCFQNLCILNPNGEVIVSTDKLQINLNYVNEEFFERGIVENIVCLLFLDENRDLKVHFSGPIFLEDKLLGVVMVTATTRSIISMVEDYSGLGKTGETLLAKRDENGDALFITPLRFDKDAVLTRRVSKEALELPITQALLRNEQLFTDSIDYRGKSVLAATRYIEDTDWGLVVKMDRAEAFAPIIDLRNSILLTILVSSLLIILASLFTSRKITGPIINLTRTATEISRGDLSQRAKVASTDEIGILAQSFNQMTENLVEAHAGLEQKVIERTSELRKEITERKKAEEALKNAAEEKETLLKEAHHRIKNNFSLVSSLLRMQSAKIKDPDDLEIFKESQNRVLIMARLHEILHQAESTGKINMKVYLTKIISSLCGSYKIDAKRIKVKSNIDELELNSRTATSCGLIVNELFTNAYKYSFPDGRKGEINITLRSLEGDEIELIITDNGVGLPENVDIRDTETLGLHIVKMLAEDQHHGEIKLDRTKGTSFHIRMRIE